MYKTYILVGFLYADVESPSHVLAAFSTHQAAYDYGCEWWQNEGGKSYHYWRIVEVDYHD